MLIAISLVFLCGCSRTEANKQPNVTVGSVMEDITDRLTSRPDSASIAKQYSSLDADHNTGAIFYYSTLSDVEYTPVTTIEIQPQSFLFSNPGQRGLAVDTFFRQVGHTVNTLRETQAGKPYSQLYVPIAQEANRLMAIPATNRFLAVYSNLYENSFFSLYQADSLSELANHPEKVVALFQKKMPLQNLKGLHVYFIYQPTSYADSQLYTEISEVYQAMFTKAGATVTISATLQNQ